jgi:hypothetical protein
VELAACDTACGHAGVRRFYRISHSAEFGQDVFVASGQDESPWLRHCDTGRIDFASASVVTDPTFRSERQNNSVISALRNRVVRGAKPFLFGFRLRQKINAEYILKRIE